MYRYWMNGIEFKIAPENFIPIHKFCVKKGINYDISYMTLYNYFLKNNNIDAIDYFINNNKKCTYINSNYLLEKACECSNSDMIRYLLNCGMDPTIDNCRSLIAACEREIPDIEIIGILLDHVNSANEQCDPNIYSGAPIKTASGNGYLEIIKLLVKHGADPLIDENEPLFLAVSNGHADVTEYLLQNGADIRTINRVTFMVCAQNNYTEVIELLLSKITEEGNFYFQNKTLQSAFIIAAEYGNLDVLIVLVEAGINYKSCLKTALSKARIRKYNHVIKYLKNLTFGKD
jgi:ankyrin repeat protein